MIRALAVVLMGLTLAGCEAVPALVSGVRLGPPSTWLPQPQAQAPAGDMAWVPAARYPDGPPW